MGREGRRGEEGMKERMGKRGGRDNERGEGREGRAGGTNMKWEKAHHTVTAWKVVVCERIFRIFYYLKHHWTSS